MSDEKSEDEFENIIHNWGYYDLNRDRFHNLECERFHTSAKINKDSSFIHYPCVCGEFSLTHQRLDFKTTDKKVTYSGIDLIKSHPTNAVGTIVFHQSTASQKLSARYIRVSMDDYAETFKMLFCNFAGESSDTLFSIISSPKNWKIQPTILASLWNGLKKAAIQTRAMIIMNGSNTQPMEEISKSLWSHNAPILSCKNKIKYFAFMPWGDVTDREQLLNKSGSKIDYEPETYGGELPSLSHFHKNFIFVDDGLRNYHPRSCMNDFLVNFEKYANTTLYGYSDRTQNVVAILIGGDYNSLLSISKRIDAELPTVVCGGTALAADFLLLAKLLHEKHTIDVAIASDVICKRLKSRFKRIENAPPWSVDVEQIITKIIGSPHLVNICNLGAGEDFMDSLFDALMNSTSCNISKSFTAMLWNKPDALMKGDILTHLLNLERGHLTAVMYQSLYTDNVEFVKLCDMCLSNRNYITVSWMLYFYAKEDHIPFLFRHFFRKRKFEPTVLNIKKLTTKLVDSKFADGMTSIWTEPGTMISVNDSTENLFMVNVLNCHADVAEYFWSQTSSPLSMALIACRIYNLYEKIAINNFDTNQADMYRTFSEKFEKLACDLAIEAYNTNALAAIDMVGSEQMKKWGSPPILELAEKADCKNFIATLPCQLAIESLWTSNIRCAPVMQIAGMLCPLALLSNDQFQFKSKAAFTLTNEPVPPPDAPPQTFCAKVNRFYNCPRTKFIWDVTIFLAYLAYASYFIVFWKKPDVINAEEYVVMALFIAHIINSVLMMILNLSFMPLQCGSCLFCIIYMILRIWLGTTFLAAATIYSIALILLYLELFEYCLISVKFGAKVIMIGKMMIEMFRFLPFFLLFLVGFGVAEQVTLFPFRNELTFDRLSDTFLLPLYRIFGENALDDAMGQANCTGKTPGLDCAQGNWFTIVMIAAYIMLTAVLLMNLLIAIFSDIFESIDEKALLLWKCKRYDIMKRFIKRSAVFWPFNLFFDLFIILKTCFKHIIKKRKQKQHPTVSLKDIMASQIGHRDYKSNVNVDEPTTTMLENYARDTILVKRTELELATFPAQAEQISADIMKMEGFLTSAFKLINLEESDDEDADDLMVEEKKMDEIGDSVMQALSMLDSGEDETPEEEEYADTSGLSLQEVVDDFEITLRETFATVRELATTINK